MATPQHITALDIHPSTWARVLELTGGRPGGRWERVDHATVIIHNSDQWRARPAPSPRKRSKKK